MFEWNANLFVVVFALTGGIGDYLNARKAGTPITPALQGALRTTALLAVLNLLWALTLNRLHMQWNSIAGFGVGLAIGLVWLLIFLAFKVFQNRRRHWR